MKSILQKLARRNPLARFCSFDITRVLLLDITAKQPSGAHPDTYCHLLCDNDLREMVRDKGFQITPQFINDFNQCSFTGVGACVGSQIVGAMFLVTGNAAARHNSGGKDFKGIALNLPEGVAYLFKVYVKPEARGKRIMATMLHYALTHLQASGIRNIVTTTHWQNTAFLNGARHLGFRYRGFASELVLTSRHFFQLPQPFRPDGDSSGAGDDERQFIRFVRPDADCS